jgi:murein L,D-transpeptidase YcbB/YkuD
MLKRRAWALILISAIIIMSAGADSLGQRKSRGGRKASTSTRAKKEARGKKSSKKADRGRSAKSNSRVAKSRRGRAKSSRARVASAARRNRGAKAKSRAARYEAPVRASRDRDVEAEQEPETPQPRIVASGIQSERVIEIQTALIKAGVLEGPATGQYDEATSAAMKKFQVNHGLPATGLPSAHTLKRLGVSKRSNDGYAVPVRTVENEEKKETEEKRKNEGSER